MKMTSEHQTMLKTAIEMHGISEFKLPLSLVSDQSRVQQAWRIFHHINKLENYTLSDTFYEYLDDNHIQTALIKILYVENTVSDLTTQIKKEADLLESDEIKIVDQTQKYVWFHINSDTGILWNVSLTSTGKVKKNSLRHES
jgi:hypothetical protein